MGMAGINDYRAFVAIVDCGSYNAAAAALETSQPALTRRIQRLEAIVGFALLERGPWGIRLTDRGEVFYKGARRILATIEDVSAETSRSWGRTIRLGAAATAAGSFLAQRLAVWIPKHPEIHLVMIEDGARNMRARLENRECDIGVVAAPIPPHFESRFITRVMVQAIFPHSHPLAAPTGPIHVQEFNQERVLLNGEGFLSADLFRSACRLAQVEPETVYECSVGQTLAALAEGGMGIAVIGDSVDLRGFDLPKRYLCDSKGERLFFDLHIAWLGHRQLPPTVVHLIDHLSNVESLPLSARIPGCDRT